MTQETTTSNLTLSLAEFIRIFSLKGANIAWFTGAGASVAAGLPSAYDMVWDFKLSIFCSEQNLAISQYNNLTPNVKSKIQAYFDSQKSLENPPPELDSLEEYSYYFKRAYHSKDLRSEYMLQKLKGAKPTYGYKALASLMKMGLLKNVLTTNFDRLIEDAAAQIYDSTGNLYVASIDNNYAGLRYIHEQKTPALLKLHGDYHSLFLKNTVEELDEQDSKLRTAFSNICQNHGVAFIGYSGRDESIIRVIEESLQKETAFPLGFYWFVRTGSEPIPKVIEIIKNAKERGIEAYYIEIDSFEECFSSLIKSVPNLPADLSGILNKSQKRLDNHPIPNSGKNFPVLRLNAFPIKEYQNVARLIECEIGGIKEVINAIKDSKANLICTRKKQGVIGFGDDAEFDKAFPNNKKDVFRIEEKQLIHEDSTIKNIILEALVMGLTRGRPLRWIKRGGSYFIIIDPKQLNNKKLDPLNKLTYTTYGKPVKHFAHGKVPKTDLQWVDALEIHLAYQFSTLYLLINPTIRVARSESEEQQRLVIAPFVKEEMAKRLNEPYNSILEAWIKILFEGFDNTGHCSFSAFEQINGINPRFVISKNTSFTRLA